MTEVGQGGSWEVGNFFIHNTAIYLLRYSIFGGSLKDSMYNPNITCCRISEVSKTLPILITGKYSGCKSGVCDVKISPDGAKIIFDEDSMEMEFGTRRQGRWWTRN